MSSCSLGKAFNDRTNAIDTLARVIMEAKIVESPLAESPKIRECLEDLLVMAASAELCDPLTGDEKLDKVSGYDCAVFVEELIKSGPSSLWKSAEFFARITACPNFGDCESPGHYKKLILSKFGGRQDSE